MDGRGWISREERLPTAADADAWRCILAWHVYQGPMLTGVNNFRRNEYLTHWKPAPEGPEKYDGGGVNSREREDRPWIT